MKIWEVWISNKNKRDNDIQKYISEKKIWKEIETKELIEGHLEKSDHNLKFVKAALNLKEFNDWAIVSAYYAIYHASLALCAFKGYGAKDHNATLLILIKEFYKNGLQKEDLEMIDSTTLEKDEILYYVEAKFQRQKASYSIDKQFSKSEVEMLRIKAIEFVNKVKEILEK